MKQEYKDKFELKIKLDKVIEEKEISKKDFIWVLKNIFKTNLFLKKDFKLFDKYTDSFFNEVNELLELDFFISDKTLIIYIARKFNKLIEDNEFIKAFLTYYLREKDDNNSEYDNKYHRKLYKKFLIECEDKCWETYLPMYLSDSHHYNEWAWGMNEEDKVKSYPLVDEKLEAQGLDYYNKVKSELSKDELDNIKLFNFNNLSNEELEKQIKECLNSDNRNMEVETILSWIRRFENINIFKNDDFNFSHYLADKVYSLLKEDKFEYDVNDEFFMIEKEYWGRIGGDYSEILVSIGSFNTDDLWEFIDIPKWIKYMRSHNISDINNMYIDNMYDELYNLNNLRDGVRSYIDYNFSNEVIGINRLINRIQQYNSKVIKEYELLNNEKFNEKGDKVIRFRIDGYCDIENREYVSMSDNYIILGDKNTNVDLFTNYDYLEKCVKQAISEN